MGLFDDVFPGYGPDRRQAKSATTFTSSLCAFLRKHGASLWSVKKKPVVGSKTMKKTYAPPEEQPSSDRIQTIFAHDVCEIWTMQ